MGEQTPDAQAESKERIDKFKAACLAASQEFDCDFFAYPQFVPQVDGGFSVRVFLEILDKRGLGSKSPLSIGDILEK